MHETSFSDAPSWSISSVKWSIFCSPRQVLQSTLMLFTATALSVVCSVCSRLRTPSGLFLVQPSTTSILPHRLFDASTFLSSSLGSSGVSTLHTYGLPPGCTQGPGMRTASPLHTSTAPRNRHSCRRRPTIPPTGAACRSLPWPSWPPPSHSCRRPPSLQHGRVRRSACSDHHHLHTS